MKPVTPPHSIPDYSRNPALEAILSVTAASGFIKTVVDEVCAPMGMTGAQYHILRILARCGDSGCSRSDIVKNLIEKSIDVTRSVDNLISLGFASRQTAEVDKRIALHRITADGKAALVNIDVRFNGLLSAIQKHYSDEELVVLSSLNRRMSAVDASIRKP